MNLDINGKIGLAREEDFFLLLISWLAFGSFFELVHISHGLFGTWILMTSILSMMLLSAIGYFERYTPQPELTGVLSLFLALPFSAFCSKWVIVLFTHGRLMPYSEALRISVWVAIAFESAQWFLFKLHRSTGRRWVLATCLLPEELEDLRNQVAQSGSEDWIHIKPITDGNGLRHAFKLNGDETLVISRRAMHDLRDNPEFIDAHLRGQRIVDVRQLLKEFRSRVTLRNSDAWTFLLASTYQGFLSRLYFNLKGIFEPLISILLLLILLPFFVIIALAIYFYDGTPIFYRQERLGYRGEKFLLFKFRTMSMTAEKTGPRWASKDDPRVTPLGKWLRKTRLDELPQLLNVVRGELSFVGPRPERPEFYEILNKEIPLFPMRLMVRPGITGWAQVKQGYASSVEECEMKLEYDLYYVQHMSPRLDLRTVVHTLALMIRGNSGQ